MFATTGTTARRTSTSGDADVVHDELLEDELVDAGMTDRMSPS
jgi:hypothetical protein